MAAYYQLVFLGDESSVAFSRIRERFFELLRERGLSSSLIDVLSADRILLSSEEGGYDPSKPTFAFYIGDVGHADKDIYAVKKLLANADAIFPIYFSEGRFLEEVPKVLHQINGKLYSEEHLDAIVNVAFEELRLLRKKRRIFISYKRSDSVAIANQLYDLLSRHQFDVFMDTYSIRGGAEFQKELHHKITDSDVLIQLNSSSFMDSKWCREEICFANMHQIGVLQVNWPDVKRDGASELCYKIALHDTDFRRKRFKRNTSLLKKKVLDGIVSKVESIRARNLAARADNLKGEFIKEAMRQGRNIVSEPLHLAEQTKNGYVYYIPTIGVPQSVDYHESLIMLEKLVKEKVEGVFLIYDDLSILPKWIDHLDWMDKYLEVRTIKKHDFGEWLTKN